MIQVNDLYWAAGFLEGEGSFCVCGNQRRASKWIRVAAGQKQREPLERLVKLFGGKIYINRCKGEFHCFQWQTQGPQAIGIMMTLYSLMSPRRKEQIRLSLAYWEISGHRRRLKLPAE